MPHKWTVGSWTLMDDHVCSVLQLLYHWDWLNIVLPDTSVIRHTIKSGLIWLLLFFIFLMRCCMKDFSACSNSVCRKHRPLWLHFNTILRSKAIDRDVQVIHFWFSFPLCYFPVQFDILTIPTKNPFPLLRILDG